MTEILRLAGSALLVIALVACAGGRSTRPVHAPPSAGPGDAAAVPAKPAARSGRYHLAQDTLPTADSIPADVYSTPDAVPRHEPLALRGNPDSYAVAGRTYHVMASNRNFSETGIASWYGRKFHGYSTSSGETYDMFGMTAAHKTLPLPSYVRVTNLANGREVVVRVNDRGPFHDGRVIDLSYAAAARLGVLEKGTAPVRISTLEGGAPPTVGAPLYLQVGAFGTPAAADRVIADLGRLGLPGAFVTATDSANPLYRVRLGPYGSAESARQVRSRLEANGYSVSALRY